jgi:hypothetical protein
MRRGRVLVLAALVMSVCTGAYAQLNENCIVAVLNRSVQVKADGSWVLPNIPANFGLVKARATCVQNGVTTFGESPFFNVAANGTINLPTINLGSTTPIPISLSISPSPLSFSAAGQTTQLTVTATYPDNSTKNVSAASAGTAYTISNPTIATITADGLVTAVSSGTVVIQATNEGASGISSVQVVIAGASLGGIPLSWATANGLDPTDPNLPLEDPDRDGLTNLQEFQIGTNPNNPDTDGDGLSDGDEVNKYNTNPLLFSTDGSGIPDGIEASTGTIGAPFSVQLKAALQSIEVKPSSFVLDVNAIEGQASQQLTVTGHLIDGKTTLDLTSTQKLTNYSSSDLTVCNFGSPDGNVFAGSNGSCTITVSNSGFTATASVTVTGFSPIPLSFVGIPGFANGVAVNGNYAYVAAGAAGLQIVNVSNRSNPVIAGSLTLPGNSNDIRIVGNVAYIAGGTAGLQAVDVTNPASPRLLGTLATGANALDLVIAGNTAYIANASNLVIANVTNPAAMIKLGTLPLAGPIQGVDVDVVRNLAVVAAGTTGIYVVDVSNPASPVLRGSLPGGDARDVAISGNYAFVADYTRSTTSVDISLPTNPIFRSNITDPNLGGFLQDIVVNGSFALGADVKFVNGIPITDISNPIQLLPRAILKFTQRDDNGMGIAADGSYVYLTTEHSSLNKFGSSGDSRLYIGQYRALQDRKGIPPAVSVSAPAPNSTVIQGATLPITVNATDDVGVAAVNFLVNNQIVFTSTASPYQFNYPVPTNATSLVISATAVDFGGNIGTAQTVNVTALPDPGTTVTGATVDGSNSPVVGAAVTCLGVSGTSGTGGVFSIPGVPTVQGAIQCRGTGLDSSSKTITGVSSLFVPVVGGTTNVGTIMLLPPATTLVIGLPATPGNGNCFPFGCGYNSEYQQIYTESAFTGLGPVRITQLLFYNTQFNNGAFAMNSGTWTISLSTTSKDWNTLSSTFASNIGPDNQIVFSGNLSQPWSFPKTMTITLTNPFVYDPSQGNLLMDIITQGVTTPGGSIYFDSTGINPVGTGSSTVTSRDYCNFTGCVSGTVNTGYGLVTGFGFVSQ